MCVEVGRGDPLPSKNSRSPIVPITPRLWRWKLFTTRIQLVVPALLSEQSKRASISLPLTQAPGVEGICARQIAFGSRAHGLDGGGCHAAHVLADVNLASRAVF
ncbi:hypothetical protein Nepgr_027174 [Nepenthes gracilis]|uniref:Uncharacterized protein n=1 Tax=Nepenthes gracilis TaxID=150966 RepID=A0AAD3TA13_NEPGR|nr:hypothetical protein Nepgr_027174 [Nepenthes gracilis]